MSNLKASFEEVADWCEKYLESKRGREIGMTFGGMLRAYGRLATIPGHSIGDDRSAKELKLDSEAEKLLLALCSKFIIAQHPGPDRYIPYKPLSSMRTNMIYDPGEPPKK